MTTTRGQRGRTGARGPKGTPGLAACEKCKAHEEKILDLLNTISDQAKDIRSLKATNTQLRKDMDDLGARLDKIEALDA